MRIKFLGILSLMFFSWVQGHPVPYSPIIQAATNAALAGIHTDRVEFYEGDTSKLVLKKINELRDSLWKLTTDPQDSIEIKVAAILSFARSYHILDPGNIYPNGIVWLSWPEILLIQRMDPSAQSYPQLYNLFLAKGQTKYPYFQYCPQDFWSKALLLDAVVYRDSKNFSQNFRKDSLAMALDSLLVLWHQKHPQLSPLDSALGELARLSACGSEPFDTLKKREAMRLWVEHHPQIDSVFFRDWGARTLPWTGDGFSFEGGLAFGQFEQSYKAFPSQAFGGFLGLAYDTHHIGLGAEFRFLEPAYTLVPMISSPDTLLAYNGASWFDFSSSLRFHFLLDSTNLLVFFGGSSYTETYVQNDRGSYRSVIDGNWGYHLGIQWKHLAWQVAENEELGWIAPSLFIVWNHTDLHSLDPNLGNNVVFFGASLSVGCAPQRDLYRYRLVPK